MNKDKSARVFHFDLYGKREAKYNFLNENSLDSIEWNELELKEPNFLSVKKDFNDEETYKKGFAIVEVMPFRSSGIKTHDDEEFVSDNIVELDSTTCRKSRGNSTSAVINPRKNGSKIRKGRPLNFEDIFHYQKIIVALTETDRLMKEIDNIEIE